MPDERKLQGFADAAKACNVLSVAAFQFTFFAAGHDSVGMGWILLLVAFSGAQMPWSVLAWAGVVGIVAGLFWKTRVGAALQLLGAAALLAAAIGVEVNPFCVYFYGPCVLALSLDGGVLYMRLGRARTAAPAAAP